MSRSYTNLEMITLPTVSASDQVVLVTRLGTAYHNQRASLAQQGEALPSGVVKAMTRLETAGGDLANELQPTGTDSKAAVSADSAVDDAWGALRDWLTGWTRLPAARVPNAEHLAALYRVLFGDGGLSFLTLSYENEWQQSQARIDAMAQERYRGLIAVLGGVPFMETLLEAQTAYGQVLGITSSSAAAAAVREKMLAAQEALRDYVLKVRALVEPDDDATEALAGALLEPLTSWDSRSTSSSSRSTPATTSSSTAQQASGASPSAT